MAAAPNASSRRLAEPRGTILVICLLLMVVAAFMGTALLALTRTEATMTATARGSLQAMNAAEFGLEFAVNSLDPSQVFAPFPTQTLAPGVRATAGLRDGSNPSAVNQGPTACPPGYSLALGCSAYTLAATGWARAWLVATASTQLERAESIYQGCAGTEYSC